MRAPKQGEQTEEAQMALSAVGALASLGEDIDWSSFYAGQEPSKVVLPTYVFEQTRCWFKASVSHGLQLLTAASPVENPCCSCKLTHVRRQGGRQGASGAQIAVLGSKIESPFLPGAVFEHGISGADLPYLEDHRIDGIFLVPAAYFVSSALELSKQVGQWGACAVTNIAVPRGCLLTETGSAASCTVQVGCTPADTGFTFEVCSSRGAKWDVHCTGGIESTDASPQRAPATKASLISRCGGAQNSAATYAKFDARLYNYGPSFQWLSEVWTGDNVAVGSLEPPVAYGAEPDEFAMSPGLVDGCIQLLLTTHESPDLFVPSSISKTEFFAGELDGLWCHAELVADEATLAAGVIDGNVSLYNSSGALIMRMTGLRLTRVSPSIFHTQLAALQTSATGPNSLLHNITWQPKQVAGLHQSDCTFVIFADTRSVGQSVATALQASGSQVHCVYPTDIDPTQPADYVRVLAGKFDADKRCVIVHCRSVSVSDDTVRGDMQINGVGSALLTIQAAMKLPVTPRVYFVTAGAQAVSHSDNVSVGQAPINGFASAVRSESPELNCTLIDVEHTELSSKALVSELLDNSPEQIVAIRGATRFVPRLALGASAVPVPRQLGLGVSAVDKRAAARRFLRNIVEEQDALPAATLALGRSLGRSRMIPGHVVFAAGGSSVVAMPTNVALVRLGLAKKIVLASYDRPDSIGEHLGEVFVEWATAQGADVDWVRGDAIISGKGEGKETLPAAIVDALERMGASEYGVSLNESIAFGFPKPRPGADNMSIADLFPDDGMIRRRQVIAATEREHQMTMNNMGHNPGCYRKELQRLGYLRPESFGLSYSWWGSPPNYGIVHEAKRIMEVECQEWFDQYGDSLGRHRVVMQPATPSPALGAIPAGAIMAVSSQMHREKVRDETSFAEMGVLQLIGALDDTFAHQWLDIEKVLVRMDRSERQGWVQIQARMDKFQQVVPEVLAAPIPADEASKLVIDALAWPQNWEPYLAAMNVFQKSCLDEIQAVPAERAEPGSDEVEILVEATALSAADAERAQTRDVSQV